MKKSCHNAVFCSSFGKEICPSLLFSAFTLVASLLSWAYLCMYTVQYSRWQCVWGWSENPPRIKWDDHVSDLRWFVLQAALEVLIFRPLKWRHCYFHIYHAAWRMKWAHFAKMQLFLKSQGTFKMTFTTLFTHRCPALAHFCSHVLCATAHESCLRWPLRADLPENGTLTFTLWAQ